MQTSKSIRLTESTIMLAFATVLSLIKIVDMPFGGSVTACSMLPILIIAYRYGTKWGLFTAFVYSVLQLILGVSNVLNFFTLSKHRAVITADMRVYVISLSNIAFSLANTLIIVFLAQNGVGLVELRFWALAAAFLRAGILSLYCHKRYAFIDEKAEPNFAALNKSKDALFHEVLYALYKGAPIALITLILRDMAVVSVYNVYSMVIMGIAGLLAVFSSGLAPSFGNVIMLGEMDTLGQAYGEFEFTYYSIITAVYTVAMVMIMPFVRIYTRGVTEDFTRYAPSAALCESITAPGWVQPFGDTPLDNEPVGETVYMHLINRAKDYVYINTPYLIIDNEMITALTAAAKSGVDVRIVTPAISDSALVHEMTRSYYETLILAGVKIYEYTPGMVHAKTFIADDRSAVVGTINLDYRSLYLHFECGVWMCDTPAIADMKAEYLSELERSAPITEELCLQQRRGRRLIRAVLRTLAPLF